MSAARQKLNDMTVEQDTPTLLAALATMEPRWTTDGLERHESLVRHVITTTLTRRHGIAERVNELHLDEVDGFDGTELEAIMLALAEVDA